MHVQHEKNLICADTAEVPHPFCYIKVKVEPFYFVPLEKTRFTLKVLPYARLSLFSATLYSVVQLN